MSKQNKYKQLAESEERKGGRAKLNNRHGTGNGHGVFYSKKRRQQEAEERQAARDERSAQQQLARLDELGFEATRERKRLQKYLKA